MILAEDEVGLGTDHAGIMVLENGIEPGTPLADVLPLTETVLELETSHNRPDLLAVYGIAREVAALYDLELAPPPGTDPPRSADETVNVEIEDLEGCPRYVGRLFRDATIAPSPLWLKARLLAAGMRPISNVVDVTNYVMLALGNPLHAFDFTTLAGGRIVVRRARAGEKLRTLDGVDRELEPYDLMIADGERSVALAGIMGGEETEIGEQTTEILLEAANFEPYTIFRTSERLRLRTEGSNRWEKGVDPYLAEQAAKLATQLLVELAGATWVGHADVHGDLPERPVVTFRTERTDAVVGIDTPPDEQHAILRRLGFEVNGRRDRPDVARTRRHARDRRGRGGRALPARGRARAPTATPGDVRPPDETAACPPPDRGHTGRLRLLRGVHVEPAARRSDAGRRPPAGTAVERAGRPAHVARRGDARLGPTQRRRRQRRDRAVRARARLPPHAATSCRTSTGTSAGSPTAAWLSRRGRSRASTTPLGVEPVFEPADELPVPGRGARTPEGWVASVRDPDLPGEWGAFELDVDALVERIPDVIVFEDVITFPPVRQDLAFTVGEDVTAGELASAAIEAAGPALREMRAFDVYRGDQVGPGRKSIAFSVAFQAPDRTLTDEDAAELRNRIVDALAERFGAQLRA